MTAIPNDDEYEVLSDREMTAARAVRATIFGLVCPPLLLYGMMLLFKAHVMPGKLEGRCRQNLQWVSCLAGVIVLFIFLSVVMFFRGPPGFAAELRTLAHPEVLVGTWEGAYTARDEIHLFMRLSHKGGIEFRESGPVSRQYSGAWAYDNHTFFVCYDQTNTDDVPIKGKLLRYDIESIYGKVMVLRIGPDKVRMVRTK